MFVCELRVFGSFWGIKYLQSGLMGCWYVILIFESQKNWMTTKYIIKGFKYYNVSSINNHACLADCHHT